MVDEANRTPLEELAHRSRSSSTAVGALICCQAVAGVLKGLGVSDQGVLWGVNTLADAIDAVANALLEHTQVN